MSPLHKVDFLEDIAWNFKLLNCSESFTYMQIFKLLEYIEAKVCLNMFNMLIVACFLK